MSTNNNASNSGGSSNHEGVVSDAAVPEATSSACATSSPTQRRVATSGLTPAQMDSIGGFDSDLEIPTTVASKQQRNLEKKQTPPPSPPPPPSTSNSSVELATTVDVGRPISSRMEIEQNTSAEEAEDDDDFDADLERLLGNSSTTEETSSSARNSTNRRGCCARYHIGNTTVYCPNVYQRTGYGIMGPHWFGPLCTLGLLLWASHHFIKVSKDIGPVSHAICILFTITSSILLLAVSCGDPGIVRDSKPPSNNSREWRWCDFCNVYQPPDGAHCPDCNVCVEGYDHHCVWMGTCVGRKNFTAFKWFNLSWLFYLIYAIAWVTFLGPQMFHTAQHHDNDSSQEDKDGNF